MEYNFRDIEQKWQKRWVEMKTYRVTEDPTKKKFYVLNMFPYPSGAGLHVGHPLGYIASDIYARYKRQKGYNVPNSMLSRQDSILRKLLSIISTAIALSWTRLGSRSTGNVRCAPATPSTTSGRSGHSSVCSRATSPLHHTRLSLPLN